MFGFGFEELKRKCQVEDSWTGWMDLCWGFVWEVYATTGEEVARSGSPCLLHLLRPFGDARWFGLSCGGRMCVRFLSLLWLILPGLSVSKVWDGGRGIGQEKRGTEVAE